MVAPLLFGVERCSSAGLKCEAHMNARPCPLRVYGLLQQAMAELLTRNKLSELACLTLYLMYEKKNGKQSVWYEFIKARGRAAARFGRGA